MSRGLGKMQRRIIDGIAGAGTISLNRLCWELAGEPPAGPTAISNAFHSGFRRATHRLREDGYIVRVRRRLTGIDELADLYPFKTRRTDVKALRLQLLPVAKAYLAQYPARKFTPAQNETYFYGCLADDIRTDAERRWQEIEGALFAALATADSRAREAVLALLVRGKQLFLQQPMRHAQPFSLLVEAAVAAARPGLNTETVAELRAFAALFPTPDLARLKLKSDLYQIAHFGRDSHPHIKDDFIDHLNKEAGDVMRALPGYKPAGRQRFGNLAVPTKEVTSPLIHKLIQRDALAPFEFLSLKPVA